MATCAKCNVSYGADVRWCPSDGSPLAAAAATAEGESLQVRPQQVASFE